jgi:hypothetical protein
MKRQMTEMTNVLKTIQEQQKNNFVPIDTTKNQKVTKYKKSDLLYWTTNGYKVTKKLKQTIEYQSRRTNQIKTGDYTAIVLEKGNEKKTLIYIWNNSYLNEPFGKVLKEEEIVA